MDLSITLAQHAAAERVLAGRSSATVLAAMSPQQPDALMGALLIAARRLDVRMVLMFADLEGIFGFADDAAALDIAAGRLRLVSVAGAVPRGWTRLTDHLPYSLWDFDRMVRAGVIVVDIVVARMRGGEAAGHVGYGAMVGYTAAALASPAAALFEIEEAELPGFRGTPPVRRDRAEIVLAASVLPRRGVPASAFASAAQKEVGRRVGCLVPDGATLQLGLGSIADSVIPGLSGRRDLGLHSGILMPALAPLIDAGVINGTSKAHDAGLAVATGVYGAGDASVSAFGARTELRPVSATHDPQVLAAQQRLWAVNSALEIDLSAQVNAEYADGARVSSAGGLSDFARAAHASSGGASVIALPSRTRNGRSRLVTRLPAGSPPSLQGQDVDYVVTEYGAAALRGLSARDKARALIEVAHPDDRSALRRGIEDAAVRVLN